MTHSQPASVELRGVDVVVNQREILRHIDLNVLPGELFVVLGGAGSGKSTLLRSIAGLDPVAAGSLWIDDQEITRSAANRRPIALMFQSYRLWPHMPVARNVGFALDRSGLGASDRRGRVTRELAFVGLSEFARHLPWQLNPSQRQRVALARTLAADARVILLDEPFSAQDAQRREHLLRVLRKRLQQSAATTLLTTQDRSEALRVADRIAVVHEGEIQQTGTPIELYDTPRNRYVAEYMGSANLIDGEIEFAGEQALFRAENGIVIPLFDHPLIRPRTGTAMFRPHDLHVVHPNAAPFGDQIRFSGRVEQTEFLGDSMRYSIEIAGKTVWMDRSRSSETLLNVGDQVVVGLDPARIRILEG
ncbi:MAG: ABC transporter ATP-binding protein [Chromatiaceae bacterium]|nr:ABC transporter ATP-binding protein [Gammaproteobacteria bacterium]MCP5304546.1 ABC transporter ATP-binding protein [Chromatiaceae bacterium]MCP5314274.1 ABC transporter ATP-binding protein [Chromatiaceae bacterium]